ncbi:UbiX family flavin prenyltransferase [Pelotomaculum propionicicum]|uniref:Flavin prenyltransferase UbiX n=1 Tax=Pelotomaculum propionicicum TaxID=258475 RepID=A0A4Y7RJP6_9FIRM|nr:UbiX family flavin prenyltransferase [Pelotomaculum propionicicum]NLI11345.1 UbiX family flavin prenyltransferase [Peptococcaceae bacterium]TEB08959.1 putative UbiX-like flavin prenyltransferase [Pelotomaculum propionicicum]
MKKIIIAISGASGAIYGIRLLEELIKKGAETHLIISGAAKETIMMETNYSLEELEKNAHHYYNNKNIAAAPASGSFLHDGMVIAPCSMKTLSAIAHGYADNLINRAADVTIKEKRRLILVTRETPLSVIHLENMLKLARLGVFIMPPVTSFYHRPQTVEDIIDQLTGRLLDELGIENSLARRWPEV